MQAEHQDDDGEFHDFDIQDTSSMGLHYRLCSPAKTSKKQGLSSSNASFLDGIGIASFEFEHRMTKTKFASVKPRTGSNPGSRRE